MREVQRASSRPQTETQSELASPGVFPARLRRLPAVPDCRVDCAETSNRAHRHVRDPSEQAKNGIADFLRRFDPFVCAHGCWWQPGLACAVAYEFPDDVRFIDCSDSSVSASYST